MPTSADCFPYPLRSSGGYGVLMLNTRRRRVRFPAAVAAYRWVRMSRAPAYSVWMQAKEHRVIEIKVDFSTTASLIGLALLLDMSHINQINLF